MNPADLLRRTASILRERAAAAIAVADLLDVVSHADSPEGEVLIEAAALAVCQAVTGEASR